MAEAVLQAEVRSGNGKGEARKLRRAGFVPGVLFGAAVEPLPVKVPGRDLERVLAGGGSTKLVRLRVEGAGDRSASEHSVLVREVQRDPVRRDLLHVDLLAVRMDRAVHATVPVVVVGEEEREAPGIVSHLLRELEVQCLPDRIPGRIEVDVRELPVGETITVGDLKLPAGVKALAPAEEAVVSILSPTRTGAAVEPEAEAAKTNTGEPAVGKPKAAEEEE